MALVHNPRLIEDGLFFYIDAANEKCYSGSGTALSDLSYSGNDAALNGTLVTNGNFEFDGANDDIGSFGSHTLTNWTFCYWYRHDSASTDDMTIGERGSSGNRFYHRDTGANYKLRVHNDSAVNIEDMLFGEDLRQSWNHLAYGMNSSGAVQGWSNGVTKLSTTTADSSTFVFDIISQPFTSSTYYWPGGLNLIMGYNRLLTTDEVQTIFNAQRGRYNI